MADDLLADLDAACTGYACGCLHHQAARTIRNMRAADHRKTIGARRMQERLHDLLATALMLRQRAVHATDCPCHGQPEWLDTACTCGLRDAQEALRRLL